MGYRIGTEYFGSSSIQTSVANQELVPTKPEDHTVSYHFKKLSFDNTQECNVLVNEKNIYLKAGQGFESGYDDPLIYSFKIVQSGIEFNWIAAM